MLEDQGVDQVSVFGRHRTDVRPRYGFNSDDEHVGEGPLLEHLVERAAIDCLAEKFHDRLIAPAVAGIEQLGQTVRDHEAEHGQDREDGEQLTLVASEYLKRHGVPRVSIGALGQWIEAAKKGLAAGCFSQPPLTRPDTLAYVA